MSQLFFSLFLGSSSRDLSSGFLGMHFSVLLKRLRAHSCPVALTGRLSKGFRLRTNRSRIRLIASANSSF